MRTGWVRYPAGAVLVAAAVGLLVSAGAARAAPGGPAGGRLSRPQTAVTACGYLTLERVGGHVMAAGDCAGRLVLPGAEAP
jgi:hypothetical protein